MNAAASGWEARRRRVAQEIEDTALVLFAAHGYDAVSVADIARALGISERTFFRYFATKADLLLALPRRLNSAIHDELQRQPRDLPMISAIRNAISHVDKVVTDRQRLLRWTRALMDERASAVIPRIDNAFAYRDFLAGHLGSDPDADLEVAAIAAALSAAQGEAFRKWLEGGARDDLGALGERALRALVDFNALSQRAGDQETLGTA